MNSFDPWQYVLSPIGIFVLFILFVIFAVAILAFGLFAKATELPEEKPPSQMPKEEAEKMINLLTQGTWLINDGISYFSNFKWQYKHLGTSLKLLHGNSSLEVFFPEYHPQEKTLKNFQIGEEVKFERNSLELPDSGEYYPASYLTVSLY